MIRTVCAFLLIAPAMAAADFSYTCGIDNVPNSAAATVSTVGSVVKIHIETPTFVADVEPTPQRMNGDVVAQGVFSPPGGAPHPGTGTLLVSDSMLAGEAKAHFKTLSASSWLLWNCQAK